MMVFESTVNWWAILVAIIANSILGMAWYSPSMFGNEWIKLMGWDIKKMKKPGSKDMMKSMFGGILTAGVMAYMLNAFAKHTGAYTWVFGMQLGFYVWLGFIATVTIGGVLWEKRPWKLFFINNGYWLISMLMIGAIIGGWQ